MFTVPTATPEQFAHLRETLKNFGFTEEAVRARAGMTDVFNITVVTESQKNPNPLSTPFDALYRLLLDGPYVDRDQLTALLGPDCLDLFESFGLLAAAPDNLARLYSPVVVSPVQGLYLISDRTTNPDGSRLERPLDSVYPAGSANTQRFLDVMPNVPCDAFLELCSGTGIGALVAARDFAKHAWAADIADRSTKFCEFNSSLNGIANVTAITGDLYACVSGQTFDRIVAHPPYYPSLKPSWIFQDGGHDGEQVTKRIIQGLPDHLRPGGQFFMLAMATDRTDAPFEQRMRAWLGEAGSEFDVALIQRRVMDPSDFALRALPNASTPGPDGVHWKAVFQRLQVTNMVYAVTIIQRHMSARPAFTVRRENGPRTHRPEVNWMLSWEAAASDGSGLHKILDHPLTAARNAELHVVSTLQGEDWIPADYTLKTDYPFSMECKAAPWLAYLLGKCDGVKTGRTLLRELEDNDVIFRGTPPEEFADALQTLVSGGFLRIEDKS